MKLCEPLPWLSSNSDRDRVGHGHVRRGSPANQVKYPNSPGFSGVNVRVVSKASVGRLDGGVPVASLDEDVGGDVDLEVVPSPPVQPVLPLTKPQKLVERSVAGR